MLIIWKAKIWNCCQVEKAVNPQHVDWSGVSARNFRYTVRQKPGTNNALGVVKFLFPNEYDVYLHDTPSKSLFNKASRAFSHGCVRLEKPLELAEYLLQDTKWDVEKIAQTIDKRQKYPCKLGKACSDRFALFYGLGK
ncbi:MAG: L,D-transpeptidase family protein [Chitinophagales bacterium]|nr:L,D-transpeptidase family protein [Chitinophagales bacterium]